MICRTVTALLVPLLDGWRPTSNGYIDSDVRPIRCHWEAMEDAPRCEAVLLAAERAWDVQVDTLGFEAPMPDDDGRLDIYLSDDETGGGAYAFGPSVDEDPDDGKRGCHAFIGIDPSVDDAVLDAYVVHEFNHVLQYATDFGEPTLPLWEGTAHAVEGWTLEGHVLDASNIADFQRTPWVGLLADGYLLWDAYELWSYYEYGAAAWILYLDHEFGRGDGTTAAALWNATAQPGRRNEPDVLDAFELIAGDDALMEFAVARTAFGTESAPDWAAQLGDSSALGIEAEIQWSPGPSTLQPTVPPYQTGATYWRFANVPEGATLTLEVEGPSVSWGVLARDDVDAAWVVDDALTWAGSGTDLVVGVVNLGGPGFDGDDAWAQASFSLHVDTDDPGSGDTETGSMGVDTDPKDADTDSAGLDAEESGCACGPGGPRNPGFVMVVGVIWLACRRRRTCSFP